MFGIDDIIANALPLVKDIIDKAFPDPTQRLVAQAQIEATLRTSLQAWDASQNEVNKQEAASSNMFVAGGRPFIMWVFGGALALQYIVVPIFNAVIPLFEPHVFVDVRGIDDHLWELMVGMLGLGGMRMYEKVSVGTQNGKK